MKRLDRRTFLRQSAIAGGAVVGLGGYSFGLEGLITRGLLARSERGRVFASGGGGGYGKLFPTPSNNTGETILALPEGFQYNVIGRVGSLMSDGRPTPAAHDGMATFDVKGLIHLVRNHENDGGLETSVAFGDLPYDIKATGGTTTLVVNPKTRLLVRDFASLSGTVRNCAGGPTPWGTWISSEETIVGPATPNRFYTQLHGYNFEVSASATEEAKPVALTAMGRFSHEAVAVDPATGIIYETEDANPSGFYRFIPNEPGFPNQPANLAAGGLLQMLAVRDRPNYDTRTGQQVGERLPVIWVDIDDPDPDLQGGATSVFNQGRARGGALFSRLEGCWYGDGRIFFVSTSGGDIEKGQVWQYRPGRRSQGHLTLLFESPDAAVLESPDNICVSPRGGLVLCEDGADTDYVRGLTRDGAIFDFAYNVVSTSEFAGATFSPDGQTLFVNIQGLGQTFAIWPRKGYAWEDGAL